jgi:hypothetical protein
MSDKENKENLPECKEDDKECQQKYRDLITASEDNIDKKVGVATSKKGGKRSTRQRKSRRHRRRATRGRK